MIIKVCGMKYDENIRLLDSVKPDITGFIFYDKSPRYVGPSPGYLPENSSRAGVFVNHDIEYIIQKAKEFELDIIQLHGNEDPELCRKLKEMDLTVVKTFHVSSQERGEDSYSYINNQTAPYNSICDYFLFDTSCKGYGGSGISFNWDCLKSYNGNTPFILSGGISPTKLEYIKTFHHERFAGIDINSGFEISPGLKDITLIRDFINEIRRI